MKKKNSIAKFSIKKNTVAKLDHNKAVSVVGGAGTGGYCQLSYDYSCFSPCGSSDATYTCDNDL